MVALVMAVALSLAPPRALPSAELVVHAPSLKGLSGLSAFMDRAGQRSALARTSTYAPEFHPLLPVDPFSPESLERAGISSAGPATMSVRGDTKVTCTELSDVGLFERSAQARLSALGETSSSRVLGIPVRTAAVGPHLVAAYVVNGRAACAARGTSLGPAALKELARLLAAPPRGPLPPEKGLEGAVFIWAGGGVAGLDGRADRLVVDALTPAHRDGLALAPAAPTPDASVPPSGLAWVRMRVEPQALARSVRETLGRVCSSCQTRGWEELFGSLGPLLTGELLTRVDAIHVELPLTDAPGQLSALKQATLLEVKDARAARALLGRLAGSEGLSEGDGGVRVAMATLEVHLAVEGRFLAIATSAPALEAVTPVFSARATSPLHSLEAALDGPGLARALGQVSLLDVVADQRLAGLFAAGTEAGPLLAVTRAIRLWADPLGRMRRLHLFWELAPGRADPR